VEGIVPEDEKKGRPRGRKKVISHAAETLPTLSGEGDDPELGGFRKEKKGEKGGGEAGGCPGATARGKPIAEENPGRTECW